MSIFQNPLMSVAGIKERAANSLRTVVSSLTLGAYGGGVESASQNKLVKASAEAIGNNPWSSALAIATGVSGVARKAVVSTVSKLSTTTKVVGSAAGLITAGAVATNPTLAAPLVKGVSSLTPESLVKYGSNVGNATENPSLKTVTKIFTDNPVLSTVIGGAGLLLLGKSKIVGAAATALNTNAINDQTSLMKDTGKDSKDKTNKTLEVPDVPKAKIPDTPSKVVENAPIPMGGVPTSGVTPVPTNPAPASVTPTAIKSTSSKRKRKRHVCTGQGKSIKSLRLNLNVNGVHTC